MTRNTDCYHNTVDDHHDNDYTVQHPCKLNSLHLLATGPSFWKELYTLNLVKLSGEARITHVYNHCYFRIQY